MAAYSLVTASGLSSAGAAESEWDAASAGTSRPAIAAVCARRVPGRSGRIASAVRSRSAASTNGNPVSPSWQRAASTVAPASVASSRSSVMSRVLPLPAWPAIATTRPCCPVTCQAARRTASSAALPTSGQVSGAVDEAGGVAATGGGPSRPARTSS